MKTQLVQYRYCKILVSLALFALMCALPLLGLAQEEVIKVKIDIKSTLQPSASVGLIISKRGTSQILNTMVERRADGFLSVSFPVLPNKIPKDSIATAMVTTAEGEVAFGNMLPLFSKNTNQVLNELPTCKEKITQGVTVEGQYALVESLVEIRTARRKYSQVKVKTLMDEEFINKLKKIEAGFGLQSTEELSPELNPTKLVDRLSRIIESINSYNVYSEEKKAKKTQ